MGLPQLFLRTLKGLYSGIESQMLVNGNLSGSFPVCSGVKQRCPLSPMIFMCATEPLLRHTQRDKRLRGVFVPGSNGGYVKSVGYMDDVTFVCSSEGDIRRTVNCS